MDDIMIIAEPGQEPGRIELRGTVPPDPRNLIGAAAYLQHQMQEQGLSALSMRVEGYTAGFVPLRKGVLTVCDELVEALNKLIWKLPKGTENLQNLIIQQLADEGIMLMWDGDAEQFRRATSELLD